MGYGTRSIVKSSLLNGQLNGRIATSILVTVPPLPGVGGANVRLIRPAARGYCALRGTGFALGHKLKPTSASDSFRTYAIQLSIFNQRWQTGYIAGRPTARWQGKTWYLKKGMAICAVPGTSNHGWAAAVDTGEERDVDDAAEGLDNATLSWLLANEEKFGFFHSVRSEPWHIDWYPGDTIPAAVLEWERIHGILGLGGGAATSTGDEDMPNTFQHQDGSFWISFGETRRLIKDNDDYGKAQLAYPNLRPLPAADHNGWPTAKLTWTDDEIDRILGHEYIPPAK